MSERSTPDLPPDLEQVLRDQSVIVRQDAAVFELIARAANARRWEIRIPADEFDRLTGALAIALRLRTISFQVPAAGPEVQLAFEGWPTEEALVDELRGRGFTVLVSREAS